MVIAVGKVSFSSLPRVIEFVPERISSLQCHCWPLQKAFVHVNLCCDVVLLSSQSVRSHLLEVRDFHCNAPHLKGKGRCIHKPFIYVK